MIRVSIPWFGSLSTNGFSFDECRDKNVKEVKSDQWTSEAGKVVFDNVEYIHLESLIVRHGSMSALKGPGPIGQAFHG